MIWQYNVSNDGICRLMISKLGIFITKLHTTVMLKQENQGKHETTNFFSGSLTDRGNPKVH